MSAVYYQPGRRRQRLPIQILRVGIMVTILRCGKAFSLLSKRAATTSRRPPSVCPSFNRRCTSTNRRTSSSLAAEKRRRRDSLDTAASAASSTEQSASSVLSWEKFEFSDSPKWDHRFEANLEICIGDTETSKEEALSKLYEQEAIQDAVYAKQTTQQKAAWQRLDPDTVRRSTDIVRPYINEERIHKIQTVLKQRTGNTRFLFESEFDIELRSVA